MRLATTRIDLESRRVTRPGKRDGQLSPTELRLLLYLHEHRGRFVSREELLEQVWGYAPGVQTMTVQTTIRRLRKKVEPEPSEPRFIVTVQKHGYQLRGVPEDAVPPSNLPPRLSELVGRFRELRSLAEQSVASGVAFVVGPPAVGKSRLALEHAHAVRDGAIGPVYWVDLSGAASREDVLAVVASHLDIQVGRSGDVAAQVGRALQNRDAALLVLDGVTAGVGVVEALAGGWPIRCVVTSQRRPAVREVLELGPLDEAAALALFSERSGLDATPVTRELVAKLEGLPLAIELAAARTGVLTPEQMLARLDDRLGLLRGSLRASIAAAWEQLDEDEARVLTVLSTLPAGFDAELAELVFTLAPDPRLETDVLDVITSLRGRSLLQGRRVGERLRLSVLEVIRDFAGAQAASPSAVMRQVRRAILHRGEALHRAAMGPDPNPALWSQIADVPNVEAVLEDAAPDEALALLLSYELAYSVLGRATRYTALVERHAGLTTDKSLAERARLRAARNLLAATRTDEAQRMLDAVGVEGSEAKELRGLLAMLRGDTTGALQWMDAAIEGTPEGHRADLLMHRGMCLMTVGEHARARADYEAAVAAHRRAANGRRLGWALTYLAEVLLIDGELEGAERRYEEAAEIFGRGPDHRGRAVAAINRCRLCLRRRQVNEARRHIRRGLQISRFQGDLETEALMLGDLGQVEIAAGNSADAVGVLQRALKLCVELGRPSRIAVCEGNLGIVLALERRYAEARPSLESAAVTLGTVQLVRGRLSFLCHLAVVHLLLGDTDAAGETLAAVHALVEDNPNLGRDLVALTDAAANAAPLRTLGPGDGDIDTLSTLVQRVRDADRT